LAAAVAYPRDVVSSPTPPILERAKRLTEPALRRAVDRLLPELREPARYHFGWTDADGNEVTGGGGKGVRTALSILSAEAVGAPAETAIPGAVAVELVHNFSLLHDDIIDGDTERRHRATVWSLWGVSQAIIVGDALHSLALEELLADSSAPAARAAARLAVSTGAMIAGQSDDMTFDQRNDVTFDDCLAMEANKTGALIAFSSSVGAVLADASDEQINALATFGAAVGIAFQAVDDLLGIWGDPAVTGKAVGNDLRERKRSMPVTAALHSGHAAADEIAAFYATEGEIDAATVERLQVLVGEAGGRDRTREVAAEQVEVATAALDSVDFVPAAVEELRGLAAFIVDRDF